LTCVAVLALGIGANAAIFSVVHSVILKPLPYPDPSRLVFLWQRFPSLPFPFDRGLEVSRLNYLEWKRQNTVFADMAAFREMARNETGADLARRVSTGFASANLFPLLGVRARLGRLFTPEEERPDNDRVVVLTDAYFERRFHGEPGALGRSLTLGNTAYTVIGVLPPQFHLPATGEGSNQLKPEVWVPLSRLFQTANDDEQRQLLVAARLRAGVTLAQARTEMVGIAKRLEQSDPKRNEGWTASVFPFADEDASPTLHRALYVLLGAVALLLSIACANLANLTLARATLRSREIAVRAALGATPARIVAQLGAEALVVSMTGAVCGLLLAHWCVKLLLALQPPEIQRPELIGINLAVFGFAAAAAVLTTLLFGLAPSLVVSRPDLNAALKSGGGWGASAARVRLRQFLIAAEVALALVLLSGAGLLIRSFHKLVSLGVGFDTTHLLTVDLDLPERRYPDGAGRSRFFREAMERVSAVPGVTAAAVVDNLPLHRVTMSNFSIAGRPDPPLTSLPVADMAHVSPNYFQAIGLRLEAGRFFTASDLALAEQEKDAVVIVNQTLARQFFRGEDPLGARLLKADRKHAYQIVGVVSDYRPMGAEMGTRPQIFWPYLRLNSATLIVRTAAAPGFFARTIQQVVWSLDKNLPAEEVKSMDHYVNGWLSQRKFNTLLLAVFAGLALVLAMIGIYGVLSNLVASRTREIGIRMALGARPAAIGRLVLGQSMIPVTIGLAAGVAGSLALSRFLEALLFQVRARDPLTLALAAAATLLLSPLAIAVPLLRATRVDCTVALREE